MSTFATIEHKVVSFNADSTVTEISDGLSTHGRDGWKVASTYHIHHLNNVYFVLSREIAPQTK
jgi:hypothetical protein